VRTGSIISRGAICVAAVMLAALQPLQAKDEPHQDALWSKQCAKAQNGGKESCLVQQYVSSMPGNHPLLMAQFSYGGPEGKPQLVLAAPLGILLPAGITLSIDGKKPLTAPFQVCAQGGCRSIIEMDDAALDQFRKGKVLSVRLFGLDQKPLDLPVKLEGLDAALKSLVR